MTQAERQIRDAGRSLEVAPWWLMLPFLLPGKSPASSTRPRSPFSCGPTRSTLPFPRWNLGALNVRKLTFHCSLWLLPQRERSSHTWNKVLLFFISKEFNL